MGLALVGLNVIGEVFLLLLDVVDVVTAMVGVEVVVVVDVSLSSSLYCEIGLNVGLIVGDGMVGV